MSGKDERLLCYRASASKSSATARNYSCTDRCGRSLSLKNSLRHVSQAGRANTAPYVLVAHFSKGPYTCFLPIRCVLSEGAWDPLKSATGFGSWPGDTGGAKFLEAEDRQHDQYRNNCELSLRIFDATGTNKEAFHLYHFATGRTTKRLRHDEVDGLHWPRIWVESGPAVECLCMGAPGPAQPRDHGSGTSGLQGRVKCMTMARRGGYFCIRAIA